MFDRLKSKISDLSPNLQQIIANTLWLVAGRIFRLAINFIVVAWMARYLGADQFGTLNYGIALIGIFGNTAQLGLHQFIVRDLVNDLENRSKILGTAFALQLMSGVASFLAISCTIFLLKPDDPLSRMIVIIMSCSLLFQNFEIIDSWFQSQVKLKYSVIASNIAFVIVALVRIVLIYNQAPFIAFAFTVLLESVLSITNCVIAYQRTGEKIQNWRPDWVYGKQLLATSWPLAFSNLSVMVYIYIDQIMLGQLADFRAVGIYAVAVKLSENWVFLMLYITRSFTPYIIEGNKISEKVYYERLQKLCNLLVLIFYIVAVPLTFFATPLIVAVFGQNYAAAGVVLSIHIWSSIWYCFGNVKEVWIVTEELTKFAFVTNFTGAIANILLNLLLIPIYQEVGSAIATVISYSLTVYGMCFLYPPARKFGWVMTKALGLNILTQLKKTS